MDLSSHPGLLLSGLLLGPAIVAGLCFLAGARRAGHAVAWLGALGFALGYLAGHWASLSDWPSLPPASSNESLWHAGAVAALGALASGRVPSRWAQFALVGLFHCAALALLMRNQLADLPGGEVAGLFGFGFVGPSAVAVLFDRFAERERGAGAPLALWGVATACAGAVALTGSAVYAQFSASLAAVLGAAVVVGLLYREASFTRGLALAVVPHAALLAFAGANFSELPRSASALLLLAPLAVLALPPAFLERLPRAARIAAPLAATALPLAAALFLCWQAHRASSESSYY